MKKLLTLLAYALAASPFANAQLSAIQHVIVVIQEDRTTANLFGADSALAAAGANLHGTTINLMPFRSMPASTTAMYMSRGGMRMTQVPWTVTATYPQFWKPTSRRPAQANSVL